MAPGTPARAPGRNFLAISDSSSFFVAGWKEPACLRYLVEMAGVSRPTIVFVGAANGDCANKQAQFFRLAERAAFVPRTLSLFALVDDRPETFFAGADAIYVDGGSTRNLIALMREWGADRALIDAYRAGVPVAGASAGANLMFEWGLTDSVVTRIDPIRGLGAIPGTVSVHHSTRPDRARALARHMACQPEGAPACLLDDGEFAHFRNEKLLARHAI
jgi:peptidase E